MINKLLDKFGGNILKDAGDVASNFVTTDRDKHKFMQMLSQIVLSNLSALAKAQSEVLKTEMTGNTLQRSWRPITMLVFTFIIFYRYFLAPVFNLPAIDMPDKFWDLLELGFGGYVIGRSLEKISDRVTQNADITFLKKKDRKQHFE